MSNLEDTQYWHTVNRAHGIKSQYYSNTKIKKKNDQSENVVCKMAAILSRSQNVNGTDVQWVAQKWDYNLPRDVLYINSLAPGRS